jgi:hypothetical protein
VVYRADVPGAMGVALANHRPAIGLYR